MADITIFETNGRRYQIGVLDVDNQWIIAKRIMSGMTRISSRADDQEKSEKNIEETSQGEQSEDTQLPFAKMSEEERKINIIFFIRQVLVELSDDDSRKVMRTCLNVCRLYDENAGGSPRPVLVNSPGLVLRDGNIGLDEMITLVLQVIENNLGNFLFGNAMS
jgi:hypothetical protein